ncbi:hypothetical protein D9M73_167190 [compost metagenome]
MPHVFGTAFGQDRVGPIADRYRLALGNQCVQFANACDQPWILSVLAQQPLVEVQFQASQQHLQGGCHQLAGEGLGDFATATQTLVQVYLEPRFFQFVVFHHIVHVADGDQQCDPGYDEEGDHEWRHR